MPSFVLAGPRERLSAWGVRAALPESQTIPVAERALSFLRDADSSYPRLLVGALPFAQSRPAHLFIPERVSRTGDEYTDMQLGDIAEGNTACVMECHAVPSPDVYACAVRTALDRMDDKGASLRKVVLARSLRLRCLNEIDPRAVMCRLARDPAATVFSVLLPEAGDGAPRRLVGGTPELLVSKKGDKIVSHPLAGSARRRAETEQDNEVGDALMASDKDRREHTTVTEWVADRLSPYCKDLRVPREPSLVKTAALWHLGTEIHGVLRDSDMPSLELASLLHPTPAVCGTPEPAATALLNELEGFDRGFFTGAVGWTDVTGDGAWYLAIRCAELSGANAQLYAGAGIVRGSLAESEVAETDAKLGVMMSALTGDAAMPTSS